MSVQDAIINLIKTKTVFTDVQIRVNEPLMIRTPAGWSNHSEQKLSKEEVESFVDVVAGPNWRQDLESSPMRALDVAKTIGGTARLRCNISYSGWFDPEHPEDAVELMIRKLSVQPLPYAELGLPADILKSISMQRGLWVVAGPTGNGKSTTVASILDHINKTQSKHIITIEQPIEYVLRPDKSIISQKEVGKHVPSFAMGLTAALRQHPDYIMIGEVRDADTMETMLQAAESGHMVLATLHTKNAEDTLLKLSGFLQGRGESKINALASCLCGVVSQNLIPTMDSKNLTLAYEVLVNNNEIQQLIRRGDLVKLGNVMAANRKNGCVLLNDRLRELVKTRHIAVDTALRTSYDQDGFKKDLY